MLLLHAVEQPMVESCSVLVLELIAVQRVNSQRTDIKEFKGLASTCFGGTLTICGLIVFWMPPYY